MKRAGAKSPPLVRKQVVSYEYDLQMRFEGVKFIKGIPFQVKIFDILPCDIGKMTAWSGLIKHSHIGGLYIVYNERKDQLVTAKEVEAAWQ